MMKRQTEYGFTLVELLVVIAIIASSGAGDREQYVVGCSGDAVLRGFGGI